MEPKAVLAELLKDDAQRESRQVGWGSLLERFCNHPFESAGYGIYTNAATLKSYDFQQRLGVVWTKNDFGHRL